MHLTAALGLLVVAITALAAYRHSWYLTAAIVPGILLLATSYAQAAARRHPDLIHRAAGSADRLHAWREQLHSHAGGLSGIPRRRRRLGLYWLVLKQPPPPS